MPNTPFPEKKFIVPPGLKPLIKEFEEHVKAGEIEPLMICGPSGAGKSLFLHIYKKLCQEKYGPDCRIKTVNCSHFSGDLARSELFGHAKGAFTGAEKNKEGWLKLADGGILVLEEIGDLPKPTQANLLTFVETGEFHKVGSTKTETSQVRIIASTNREENLRTDFRHRFFTIYIPPLYERRQDILYYLAHKYPDLMATLEPWEVTVLLAYNWPGNVREIENIGRLLMNKRAAQTQDVSTEISEHGFDILESDIFALPAANSHIRNAEFKKAGLCAIGSKATDLKGWMAFQLYNDLQNFGIDINYLEILLNSYHIGLAINNDTHPFSHLKNSEPHANIDLDKRFDISVYTPIPAFTSAYMGIQAFSALFWSFAKENANLLNIRATAFTVPFSPINRYFELTSRKIALFGDITAYINKNKKNGSKPPLEADICNLTHTGLMRRYLGGLLERTGGNQAEAARLADLNYTTFRKKLKRYKVR